jgi:hypothetical protein
MSRRQRSREKPFIVMVFDKYIQTYSVGQGGMIFAELKMPSLMRNLTFKSTPVGILGFGETKWQVTATDEIIQRGQMNSETTELYRKLKGMECEVEVRGTIRKEVFFKPHRSLNDLKLRIPTLQVSDMLCKALERNEEIVDLVKAINPTEMSIGLHSIPELLLSQGESNTSMNPVTEKTIEYFNNPTSITWIATLFTLFQELPFVQRKADSVIRLFSHVFWTIRKELHGAEKPFIDVRTNPSP